MKKYNLSSKSDMKRFERDMKKKVQSIAEEKVRSRYYEVECKNCHSKISAHAGYNQCPVCHHTFSLNLDIAFSK